MSAYMIDRKLSCDYGDCEKRAVVDVFNRFNEKRGQYCRRHGKRTLDALLAGEGPIAPLTRSTP